MARLARWTLAVFLFTFLGARLLVLLIMTRRLPDLYVHVGGTHIHHLNYGIFLLAGVGAWLLFTRPSGRLERASAAIYGAGLALTFDEFGMWLHLGGQYWQRASFDAIIIIAALLALLAAAPSLRRFGMRHWLIAVGLVVTLILFGLLVSEVAGYAGDRLGPRLEQIESQAPS